MSGHSVIRVAPPAPALPGRLGFGGAPLGDIFVETAEQVAGSTLRAAWDGGVRYFDTAPWYGHGLSEHRLGTFLLSVNRPDVFVSTKVGRVYLPAERREDARSLGGRAEFPRNLRLHRLWIRKIRCAKPDAPRNTLDRCAGDP